MGGESDLATEIYIPIWFELLLSSAWLVHKYESPSGIVIVVASAGLVYRVLDTSQSWYNIFIKERILKVVSVARSLALVTINFFELSVIFGLLSFFFRFHNFYPEFDNVRQSLRNSIGFITTMGSPFDPTSWAGGLLYHSEIAFGLAFLNCDSQSRSFTTA